MQDYACGDIAISNTAHPSATRVDVTASIFSPGLLFELVCIDRSGDGGEIRTRQPASQTDSPKLPPATMTHIASFFCLLPRTYIFLLPVRLLQASILHGQGLSVRGGVVRGGPDCPIDAAALSGVVWCVTNL